jgi:hypothetical protein
MRRGWKILIVAFAPGFNVPDEFVEDVNDMTYDAYNHSARDSQDYADEEGLDERMKESGKPLLVIMGAEEQIIANPLPAWPNTGTPTPAPRPS